jgi:hypothetical protein
MHTAIGQGCQLTLDVFRCSKAVLIGQRTFDTMGAFELVTAFTRNNSCAVGLLVDCNQHAQF